MTSRQKDKKPTLAERVANDPDMITPIDIVDHVLLELEKVGSRYASTEQTGDSDDVSTSFELAGTNYRLTLKKINSIFD